MTIPTPYEDLLADVLANGTPRADRTGTGTIGVFGRQIRFDLAQSFPLITTKKVFTRGIIEELLWFLAGDTNSRSLEEKNVNIWREWRKEGVGTGIHDPDRKVVAVPVRQVPDDEVAYTLENVDPEHEQFQPGTHEKNLFVAWRKMLDRCYNPEAHNYGMYGGAGVRVCKRWMAFANYSADVRKLPNWDKKLANWNGFELDKDYFGASVYSPGTTIWLSTGENNLYTKASRPFSITDEDGRQRIFLSLKMAEVKTGVPGSTLQRLLSGANKHGSKILKGANRARMGWTFAYEKPADGTNLRLSMLDGELGPIYSHQWRHWDIPAEEGGGYIDQIEALVEGIKTDPFSRRHIVSAWNVAKVPDMALPPCHTMFQFHVTPDADGKPWKLNCQLYQRSGDLFLGVPFNIASYAVLTHMIAQQTGLEVGEFIHTFGDAHVYLNHTDQVKEQLSREPRPYPQLKINRKPESIFDYRIEDFEITGYDPHPAIKAPVAV